MGTLLSWVSVRSYMHWPINAMLCELGSLGVILACKSERARYSSREVQVE